jgi:hypothetical protein
MMISVVCQIMSVNKKTSRKATKQTNIKLALVYLKLDYTSIIF